MKKLDKKQQGHKLLDQLIELTGLSSQVLRNELCHILERKNIDVEKMTVEQLRVVVASYFREIMNRFLETQESPKNPKDKVH